MKHLFSILTAVFAILAFLISCGGSEGSGSGNSSGSDWNNSGESEYNGSSGSEDSYHLGDKVSHIEKHWVSTIDYNVYEPGVYGWEEI